MRRRRRSSSPFSNPVLIGALAVLVMVVAVVLAFQANNGLPFVPRYTLYIKAPNAEELTHGAEVHMGGALVGTVSKVTAARDRSGRPIALIDAKLEQERRAAAGRHALHDPHEGSIGEKYLDVTLGHSRRTWRNGATVPLGQTSATVDLDQVLVDLYTPRDSNGRRRRPRSASARHSPGAGTGSIRRSVSSCHWSTELAPVMRNLAAPRTNLKGFLDGLGSFVSALAPVSRAAGQLYTNLDTTFKALAGVATPYLQDWIKETPPTFQAVISDGPQIGSVRDRHRAAVRRPAARLRRRSRPARRGSPQRSKPGRETLPGTAKLDQQTVGLSHSLDQFGADSTVQAGSRA